LFGSKTSVDSLQRAVDQKRFADAIYLAEELESQPLADDVAAQVANLRAEAGNGLARLNLIEARAKQDNGEDQEANVYFDMALEYADNEQLKEEIRQARHLPFEILNSQEAAATPGCNTCATASATQGRADVFADVDDAIRFDLILTSYPEDLRERYQHRGADFVMAFLLAHEGNDVQADEVFKKVKETERDDLYWFEVGAVRARLGHLSQAKESLEQSLQKNPALLLAVEALVEVLLALGQIEEAQKFVEEKLRSGNDHLFSYHALLVSIHSHRQDWLSAADHVRHCLQGDYGDPVFIALAAAVMEKVGQLEEAESLLKRLPAGGGCKGSNISLQLAEFYLRHERELEKAFSSFNAAVQQDPENPRWRLRLAQTCFARQWHKDGMQLLRQLGDAPALPAEIETEVKRMLVHYAHTSA
jgi:predicted Zn-dependent protease